VLGHQRGQVLNVINPLYLLLGHKEFHQEVPPDKHVRQIEPQSSGEVGCGHSALHQPRRAAAAAAAAASHRLPVPQSGDIFQLVLSQRYERRTFATPFEVYRALRVVNPSPYMVYMQARGCIIVSSSPEILCR